MFADVEFSEMVEKSLERTLEFVREKRAEGTSLIAEERFDAPYMYFLRDPYPVDIGEGATYRRVYAVTLLAFSAEEAAITALADQLGGLYDLT